MASEAPVASGKTRAVFIRVACKDCGNKQILFSRAATHVPCNTCGSELATPTGGRVKLNGEILETLE